MYKDDVMQYFNKYFGINDVEETDSVFDIKYNIKPRDLICIILEFAEEHGIQVTNVPYWKANQRVTWVNLKEYFKRILEDSDKYGICSSN